LAGENPRPLGKRPRPSSGRRPPRMRAALGRVRRHPQGVKAPARRASCTPCRPRAASRARHQHAPRPAGPGRHPRTAFSFPCRWCRATMAASSARDARRPPRSAASASTETSSAYPPFQSGIAEKDTLGAGRSSRLLRQCRPMAGKTWLWMVVATEIARTKVVHLRILACRPCRRPLVAPGSTGILDGPRRKVPLRTTTSWKHTPQARDPRSLISRAAPGFAPPPLSATRHDFRRARSLR